MKRVYHPSLNAWQDVADDAAKDWKEAGWRLTKPDWVDDSEALPVGEGYQSPAAVDITGNAAAYLNAPEVESAPEAEAEAPPAK